MLQKMSNIYPIIYPICYLTILNNLQFSLPEIWDKMAFILQAQGAAKTNMAAEFDGKLYGIIAKSENTISRFSIFSVRSSILEKNSRRKAHNKKYLPTDKSPWFLREIYLGVQFD